MLVDVCVDWLLISLTLLNQSVKVTIVALTAALLYCLVCSGSVFAVDIYRYTCMAIEPAPNMTRYEVPRGKLLALITATAVIFCV